MNEKVCLRFKLFKNFEGSEKQSTDALTATKYKSRVDDSCLFQSLYSRKVTGTIIALGLPSFTKKGASGLKQKK